MHHNDFEICSDEFLQDPSDKTYNADIVTTPECVSSEHSVHKKTSGR